MLAQMPMLEPFGAKQLFVLLRFSRWDEVLKLPAPDASAAILTTVHHFGARRRPCRARPGGEAERDRDAYRTAQRAIPADAAWGYNTAKAFFAVADAGARRADRRGEGRGGRGHRALDESAVAAEDALSYNEPADWYYPTRESLGAALMRAKRFVDAEKVFRPILSAIPSTRGRCSACGAPSPPTTLKIR